MTCAVAVWPTVTAPNWVSGALSKVVAGTPNPRRWPSRVPTYRRAGPTPGGTNFEPCPIGAENRKVNCPADGTASYPRSWALLPVQSGTRINQTIADPEVVPLLVTIGELEYPPNDSVLVAARLSEGFPVPSRPYLYT